MCRVHTTRDACGKQHCIALRIAVSLSEPIVSLVMSQSVSRPASREKNSGRCCNPNDHGQNGPKKDGCFKRPLAAQSSVLIHAGCHVNGSEIVGLVKAQNASVPSSEAKAPYFFYLSVCIQDDARHSVMSEFDATNTSEIIPTTAWTLSANVEQTSSN